MQGVDLTAALLADADFRDVMLDEGNFRAADVSGAQFQNSVSLRRAVFSDSFLMYSNFEYVDATAAAFNRADLYESHFDGAVLNHASFMGAELDSAKMVGVLAVGATFRYASLTNADLSRAHLQNADFRGADLTGAHFGTICMYLSYCTASVYYPINIL